ncbi:MAG: ABC transporter substrate-binding protein [Actinomycetota bacterium]
MGTTNATRRMRRLFAALLTAGLIGAACSSSPTDSDSAAVTTSTLPGDAVGTSSMVDAEDEVETAPVPAANPSRWDLDATLAADPDCTSPISGDPLRIGYAADLSEFGGPADRPSSQAAIHLAKLINCSGGFEGRPVEVVVADVSGTAVETREAVLGLLAQDVHVLLGPPFPDMGFRVLQVTDGQIPVLFTGSTEPALGDATALSYLVAFNDTQGATVAAQFALSRGWRRAVTFSSPGPYFGYNSLVFADRFESNGGDVLGDYDFIPFETDDFSAAALQIALDPPDVIYSPMFTFQMAILRRQLEDLGVEVAYLQSDVFEATGGYTLTGVEGFFHVTHAFPADGSRINALNDSLTVASGVPSEAPSFAALTGDAFAVIAEAYFASGSELDPVAIGQAIADVENVGGVTGTISYNGSGLPSKTIYVHEVVNGQPTLASTIG